MQLLVIDPQVIFADPTSPWASPMWGEVEPNIVRLIEHFGDDTIVSRWLPDQHPGGSWREYFAQWPFAAVAHDDPKLQLLPAFTNAPGQRISAPTFGKWTDALQELTGAHPKLVVTGVSTDCCVLSTVLPAADAGAYITLVSDACAGSSTENHAAALACMALYPPQVRIVTTAELLAELAC